MRRGDSLFLSQMAKAGMEPSSCVWVEGERADGLASVCRQPERLQLWCKALLEVNSTGQWWSGANSRVGHCVSIPCSNTGQSDLKTAKRESFMHKTLVFLVVAFNISIYTKPFLYENFLNYYHLKIGLTQASLIRFLFCFLQILAAIELFTQLILVVGRNSGRGRCNWGMRVGTSSLLKIFGART